MSVGPTGTEVELEVAGSELLDTELLEIGVELLLGTGTELLAPVGTGAVLFEQ